MTEIKMYNPTDKPSANEKVEIIDFLHEHLEQYRDVKPDIEKSIDFALKIIPSFGGFLLVSREDSQINGAVVVNQTGMGGYIPENILVYIATHKDARGKGIGKKLMEETISNTAGDVALHVEANNPARFLYEKYGFTNPYLEMRLKKNKQ